MKKEMIYDSFTQWMDENKENYTAEESKKAIALPVNFNQEKVYLSEIMHYFENAVRFWGISTSCAQLKRVINDWVIEDDITDKLPLEEVYNPFIRDAYEKVLEKLEKGEDASQVA